MTDNVSSPLPHQLPPDTVLANRYRLIRVLGEGGFGITYEGWDETLRMRVAVKEFFPRAFVTRHRRESNDVTIPEGEAAEAFEKGKAAFLDEARTLAQFQQNPNIVSVTNFFEENQTAYIVMEFLDGRDLKNILEQRGTVPFAEAFALLEPVMQALSVLHAHGLIHRDISPSNIMVLPDGTAKLLDFGASKVIDTATEASRSICLKPGYSPEEQYRSRGELGPWTDVYALSATMYHMLVGFPPDDSLQRILLDEVKKPSELGADIPAYAEAALMRGLAVQSKDRYQSIQEMAEAMRACQEQKTAASVKKETDRLPILSVIPVSGLLCLFEMTRRTGRKRFSHAGMFFLTGFALLLIGCLYVLIGRAAQEVGYMRTHYYMPSSAYTIPSGLYGIILLLAAVLYLARIIYAQVVKKDYRRYRLAYLQKHPLVTCGVYDPQIKNGVGVWRTIGFLPLIFGYGGMHIGKSIRDRALSALGIASLISVFLLSLSCVLRFVPFEFNRIGSQIFQIVMETMILSALLLTVVFRALQMIRLLFDYPRFFEDTCKKRAALYEAYGNLKNRQWRAENSRWQIWTFFPAVGGIGLILGGIRAKRRVLCVKGSVFFISSALLIAMLASGAVQYQQNWMYNSDVTAVNYEGAIKDNYGTVDEYYTVNPAMWTYLDSQDSSYPVPQSGTAPLSEQDTDDQFTLALSNAAKAGRHSVIAAGSCFVVGIKPDGTCISSGSDIPSISEWKDVIAVSSNSTFIAGLRKDGHVLCSDPSLDISGWQNIIQIDFNTEALVKEALLIGLMSNGTVVAVGTNQYGECSTSGWNNIVDVAAGSYHTVGLRADGTVVACGDNQYGQCNVTEWKGIVDVAAARYATYALTADGEILVAGQNDDLVPEVPHWNGVIAIVAGNESGSGEDFVVGICRDGSIKTNRSGYLQDGEIESFSDVQAVAVSSWGYTVCVDSEGVATDVGWDVNGARQVSDWPTLMHNLPSDSSNALSNPSSESESNEIKQYANANMRSYVTSGISQESPDYSINVVRELLLLLIISAAALLSFLWRICVYVGASNRFSVLTAIAEDLGPYYSCAEKEIAETDMKN